MILIFFLLFSMKSLLLLSSCAFALTILTGCQTTTAPDPSPSATARVTPTETETESPTPSMTPLGIEETTFPSVSPDETIAGSPQATSSGGIGLAAEGEFCGGIAGISCEEGLVCQYEGDYPDAGGTCVVFEGDFE